ncbi:MAG: fibronectin type III domain-containing protein [Acidobacteriota bacterium]
MIVKRALWAPFTAAFLLGSLGRPVSAAIPPEERAALIALYNSTNGDGWNNNTGWRTPPLADDGFALPGTENTWAFVYTDGNWTVTYVFLAHNNLCGTIPAELGQLINLKELQLDSNHLSGNIPAALGGLLQLETLTLGNNQLSGDIPAELGNLASVSDLYLNDNMLSGPIPPALGGLPNIRRLSLSRNQLSGAIPAELGNLTSLYGLGLSSNRLEGEVPSSLLNLSGLVNDWSDFRWNALHTSNASLREFLNQKQGGDWESTQTVAPVAPHALGSDNTSILTSWSPISYTGDDGGYRIYYSTTPGGPYTLHGSTTSKSITSMPVNGLAPGTTYYFVADTFTHPHTRNANAVISERTGEFPGTTLTGGACTPPAIHVQPSDLTISSGQYATLSVGATGTAPLRYQWYKGAGTGSPVGIDWPAYTTPPLTANAEYWVRVTNACGSVDSSIAIVTVKDTPGAGPKITSIKSKKGKPGAAATIYGSGFSSSAASNTVYFGKLKVTPKSASLSRLDVTIPSKCRSGKTYKVKVVSGGLTSNVVSYKVK